MRREPMIVPMRWYGARSVKEARSAIQNGSEIHIELPVGEHYALYMHIHPDAAPGTAGTIDASGGAELLGRLGSFRGLEDLAKLRPAVRRAGYRVRLTSPEPVLSLIPSARR